MRREVSPDSDTMRAGPSRFSLKGSIQASTLRAPERWMASVTRVAGCSERTRVFPWISSCPFERFTPCICVIRRSIGLPTPERSLTRDPSADAKSYKTSRPFSVRSAPASAAKKPISRMQVLMGQPFIATKYMSRRCRLRLNFPRIPALSFRFAGGKTPGEAAPRSAAYQV